MSIHPINLSTVMLSEIQAYSYVFDTHKYREVEDYLHELPPEQIAEMFRFIDQLHYLLILNRKRKG